MNVAEIKSQIDRMTEDERFFATAYLRHLVEARTEEYTQLLAARMQRMDAGHKFSLEEAERMHRQLEAENL